MQKLNKRNYLLFGIVLFIGSTIAVAKATYQENALENQPLELFITSSEDSMTNQPQHASMLKHIKNTSTRQSIATSCLIKGLKVNEDGEYNYNVSLYVVDPQNNTILVRTNAVQKKGKASEALFTVDSAIAFTLEKNSPQGMYLIVAQVNDLVSGSKDYASYGVQFSKDTPTF